MSLKDKLKRNFKKAGIYGFSLATLLGAGGCATPNNQISETEGNQMRDDLGLDVASVYVGKYVPFVRLLKQAVDTHYEYKRQKETIDAINGNNLCTINKIWVDINANEDDEEGNNVSGIRIHLNFDIHNLQGREVEAITYFYWENGKRLEDCDNKFRTFDGQVASGGEKITLPYKDTNCKDYDMFIPDEQLDISESGKCHLKLKAIMFNNSSNPPTRIGDTDFVHFWVNKN